MLKIENLHAYYGSIEALKGITLEVPDGKLCCIIGANGAGKTTLLKAISNVVQKNGKVLLDGKDISNASSRTIAREHVIHVPEGRQVFPSMSVYHNLEMGTINWHGFFGHGAYDKDIENVYNLFPRLKERNKQLAWSLSGGEQQMLAIGRGLMGRPKLLMLDEPSMGLAPLIVEELFRKIVEIHQQGVPILLIEQNAKLALEVSDYAYIMEQGKILMEGPSEKLRNDPRVAAAYFGEFAKK